SGSMTAFAELLEALIFTPSRNGKLRLMTEFFRTQPDPERGWALAALTGELSFREAKAGRIRDLVLTRVDAELFGWSYDFVGDLARRAWPGRDRAHRGDLAWPQAALREPLRLARRQGRAAFRRRARDVPPADAGEPARGGRSCRARSRPVPRRVEMGWDPHPA